MNAVFVIVSLLYFAIAYGLPIHSGRFGHIIHNHDTDHSSHGHKHHQGRSTSLRNTQPSNNDFSSNKIYEVPSHRHFNDNREIRIQSLPKKSYFHSQYYKKITRINNARKRKLNTRKNSTSAVVSRPIYRHFPSVRNGDKQKIVTLPETLEKSLTLGKYDHDFSITRRGVAEADLLQSKQTMTPHLPRRYIENLLKLNIWNTNNTIKVNPTSTELGRNWNIPKSDAKLQFNEHMMASEFSTERSEKKSSEPARPVPPTKTSIIELVSKLKTTTESKKSETTTSINETPSLNTTTTSKLNKPGNKQQGQTKAIKDQGVDKTIVNNIKQKHNVSKSDVIQLQGIHIMFSSMKQNLSKVIPTLHLTASLSNSSKGKSSSKPESSTFSKASDSKAFDTLIGTAVIKNGHLYLVVYPFGSSKNSSVKYHGGKTFPLSTEEIDISKLPKTTEPTRTTTQNGQPSTTTAQNLQAADSQTTSVDKFADKLSLESLDLKLDLKHINTHEKQAGHHHHHKGAHSSHSGMHHHEHMNHKTRHGPAISSSGFAEPVPRFISPWKKFNLSNVLPHLKYNSTNSNSNSEDDDSAYKLVSFIAEATDPFYKVREILGTLKNTTTNDTTTQGSTPDLAIDPAVDGTFNFELKLAGGDLTNALNLSEVLNQEKFSTEIPVETTTSSLKSTTVADSIVQNIMTEPSMNDIHRHNMHHFKTTEMPNAINIQSTTRKGTTQESLIPLHIYPTMLLVSKENDLYETIDSVIMEKLKAENATTPQPTVQIDTAPNVTLEALGINKESLPTGVVDNAPPHVDSPAEKSTTTTNGPTTTQTTKTAAATTTTTTTTTQTLPTTNKDASAMNTIEHALSDNYQTITSSITNDHQQHRQHNNQYFTNYNDNTVHETLRGKSNHEPLITLSDVLHNIRKIQLQNSVRFNLPNNNYNKFNTNGGDKVSNDKDPVVLEGPIYQDFVTDSFLKSTNNIPSVPMTSPPSNSYKSWSQHAVRQALGAMLVLSVDDILADHTTLHGTIVMAQNKDQSKDQSKDSSSNSNN